MSALLELASAVKARRSDMGLTQTSLAKLSGLSRATVNQVENGTIKDLSITRAAKLLSVLGLSLNVPSPHTRSSQPGGAKSKALDIAARSASVSYRRPLDTGDLRLALVGDAIPAGFEPHLYALLDEAPVSLLASVVEQLHLEDGIGRPVLWQRMRDIAHRLKSNRDLWQ